MALTQDDINNIVNGIVNTYTNQRIAYHGGYPGECTSPVKYYVENVTGQQAPYMANDRADGWGTDFPAELAPFFYHEAYQPGKAYPKGTVLMWNSPHIAIVVYDNGSNTIEVFEQNADPDGSPCKTASRTVNNAYHSCTYAMIPIVVNPQPTPPPPPAPKYTVIETYPQGKQIQLNKDTSLWGMNYEFAYMVDHPVETGHKAGEIWTVTNKVHHEDGYDYYRRDGQVDGFNVTDCDDYTPPYIPPAAPAKLPKVTYYTVLPDVIKYYDNAEDAKADSNAKGVKAKGDYIQLARDGMAVKLVKSNSEVNGDFWISDFDNRPDVPPSQPVDIVTPVVEPVDPPTPPLIDDVKPAIKPQYHWIRDDFQSIRLTSTNTIPVPINDLEGKYPKQMLPPKHTEDYSMYTVVNGKEYWLPDRTRKQGWMYGVDVAFLPEEPAPTTFDRNANGKADIIDLFDNGLQGFIETSTKYFDGIKKVVSTAAPKIEQLKTPVSKTIDGFIAKRKK